MFGFFGQKNTSVTPPLPPVAPIKQPETNVQSPAQADNPPPPAETNTPNSENVLDKFPQVLVAGNRLGRELKQQDQEVSIRDVFGSDRIQPSTKEVYFITDSRNVYHLEKLENGFQLVSARDAAKNRGVAIGAENTLGWEAQADNKLTVGKSFLFDSKFPRESGGGGTSSVTQIVVVDKQPTSDQNILDTLSRNPIVESFQQISAGGASGQGHHTLEEVVNKANKYAAEHPEKAEKIGAAFRAFTDSVEVSESSNAFKEGNRVEFFEKVIPLFQIDMPGVSTDEVRESLSMAIGINVFKGIKGEDTEIMAIKIHEWTKQAQLLAAKFNGDEGLDIYKGFIGAANSGNYQDYLNIMTQANTNPAVREVAKAVVGNLFADGKFEDLLNLAKMDMPLVKEFAADIERLKQSQGK